MGAARPPAHPQQAQFGGNRRLLSVARGRACRRPAENPRRARRNRRAGAVRQGFSRHPRPRPPGAVALGLLRAGDGASLIAAARPRRRDPQSRDRPVHRGSENGRGADARMTNFPDPGPVGSRLVGSKPGGSRSVLIGVIVAGIALLAVGIYAAVALSGIGEVEMSAAGWGAMLLGAVLTLALGLGLMSLVFISNRRGYDERGDHRH